MDVDLAYKEFSQRCLLRKRNRLLMFHCEQHTTLICQPPIIPMLILT